MIGQRLKLARAAAGLSLRELEERIARRVTAQAIGKYERDESMPSSPVLITLAQALAVTEDYLLSAEDLVLESVEFRKKKITSKKEEAFVEGQTLHLLERYLAVEDALVLSSVSWDKPRGAPFPVRDLADAELAAEAVRQHWQLGVDSIPKCVELFEERGIKVLSIDLADIDGLTARVLRKGKDSVPVIALKRGAWAERKRFTLAHELGHMVIEAAAGVDMEKAVDRFAGAFLMPREAMWSEIGKHRTSISLGEFLRLKQLFGASFQAITYRCKDLGIIGETLYRELFQLFHRQGWRKPPFQEPGAMDPKCEEPSRLERLCFRALAEGVFGEARVAEILGISVRQLAQRMDSPAAA
jgi:Zn-dependent peptidase ImmA (M78 family)